MTIPSLLDLACETVASAPGTGSTISLSGIAVSGGLFNWSNAGAVNGVVYRLYILDGNNRELAFATYSSSGNQFTNRTTLVASVGGTKQTTPITAGAGSIVCAYAGAEDIVTPASMLGGDINKFINGPLDVWQRGTTGTSTTTAGPTTQIGPDGWYVAPTGANVTWAQCPGRQLTQYGLQVQGAASVTDVTIKQRIEAAMAAPLSGQIVTVQGQARSVVIPSIVSLGANTSSSGATCALTGVTVPAGATIVVAALEYKSGSTMVSGTVADSVNSGSYTFINANSLGGIANTSSLNFFIYPNSAALSSATITYTKNVSGSFAVISVGYVINGTYYTTGINTGTSTSPSAATFYTPPANSLVLGIVGTMNVPTFTQEVGWTTGLTQDSIASEILLAAGYSIGSGGSVTYAPTIGTSENWCCIEVSFTPAGTPATLTPNLTVDYPTAANNYASTTSVVSAASMQSISSSWTNFAYTFQMPVQANGVEVKFDFGNNFSSSNTGIQVCEFDIRATPQAALGLNNNPPPPELRPISAELQKCQRWLWSSYPNGTTPGNAQSPFLQLVGTTSSSTSVTSQWVPYTVEMFESPALTFFSPNEGTPSNGHWTFAGTITGAGQASTATALTSASNATGFAATLTVSGATAGDAVFVFGGALATCEL